MPPFLVTVVKIAGEGVSYAGLLLYERLAACIGGALAVTSRDFTYSSVKTGYYTIHPAAMVPSASSSQYGINVSGSILGGNGCFVTGVNLPQGAIITLVTVWARSDSSGIGPTASLFRNTPANGGSATIANKNFDDDSDTRRGFSVSVPASNPARLVNNSNQTFGFETCVTTGTLFYGARITYTYRSAGD